MNIQIIKNYWDMEIIGNRQKMFFFFFFLQKKLGTKTLITSDENVDGKNDTKKIRVGINNRIYS